MFDVCYVCGLHKNVIFLWSAMTTEWPWFCVTSSWSHSDLVWVCDL